MSTATVTTKGQITIPAEVRRRLGLETGDRVEFVETEDGFAIKVANDDVRALKGLLRTPAKPVTLAAMEAAIRRRGGAL
ncbi:AbrB/MazE/SpoVT family DNA-binding domain-containing protein [Gemmatimonas sp.]|jgi:AbrB family looped-hinge helix DNA binding protein|uniref:AbrB/MazE/SpoVT family DNA-binding domain-containing protein n=1 Tax=Gemmatimonas sp. TaxID=1962908 RepID=UPI0037BFE3A9